MMGIWTHSKIHRTRFRGSQICVNMTLAQIYRLGVVDMNRIEG